MSSLPNILTLSRIFAVPLLAFFLWWPEWRLGYLIGFALYCVIALTDYLDGYLARAQGTVSKMGTFLDPIADKIMVAAVILVLTGKGVIEGIHVIAALVILLRELAVSGLREFLAGAPANLLIKYRDAASVSERIRRLLHRVNSLPPVVPALRIITPMPHNATEFSHP